MANTELYHHGIKGQRWGIRRYQNKDGSLTPAGKKRAAKLENEYTKLTGKKPGGDKTESTKPDVKKPKKLSEMSDAELQAVVNRMNLEQRYNQLNPKKVSAGEKFVKKAANDVIVPVVTEVARNSLRDMLSKAKAKSVS